MTDHASAGADRGFVVIRLLLLACLLALPSPVVAQSPAVFRSDGAPTLALLASNAASVRVQFQTAVPGTPNVRLYNAGTVAVFVECGDVTVVANASLSIPIAPGTVEVLGCQKTHLAGITASGSATLYVTPGTGL